MLKQLCIKYIVTHYAYLLDNRMSVYVCYMFMEIDYRGSNKKIYVCETLEIEDLIL